MEPIRRAAVMVWRNSCERDVVSEKPAVPNISEEEEANHGILDPAEPHHFLPEGLERKRRGPLNPRTGRRPERLNPPNETG